ncbi:hypothetical protein PI124_g22052 [Phytophthora idaei]|nr:hypothetical protein PI124_g22052 [Phytophthora idaei]
MLLWKDGFQTSLAVDGHASSRRCLVRQSIRIRWSPYPTGLPALGSSLSAPEDWILVANETSVGRDFWV